MNQAPFGYVYDERMLLHKCPYDETMLEKPERMKLIYERLVKDGLLEDAVKIEARPATDDEILLIHPTELIKDFEQLHTVDECEEYCKAHEILWLSPDSLKAARLAAGSTIETVKACVEGKIGNAFAIVRPPGHHSYGRLPHGYCMFNNVAIAAKYAVEKLKVKKVLIVDFDIHPGNGTFYSVKDDDRILFVSLHIYHYGAFWPHTRDMDYETPGNQIHVPLNAAMNTESDYLAAFQHLILPMAREFEPELILVSAGFDAGHFDVMLETGQSVKAPGYGYMVKALNDLLPNKVVAVLEGGYFPESYVECAEMMTRGLKHMPLPQMHHAKRISPAMAEILWNNLIYHSKKWKSAAEKLADLQANQKAHDLPEFSPRIPKIFLGQGFRQHWDEQNSHRVLRTREWIPLLTGKELKRARNAIQEYITAYDYRTPTIELNETDRLNQLLWDERASSESMRDAMRSSTMMYDDFKQYLDSEDGIFFVCDMKALRQAKKK